MTPHGRDDLLADHVMIEEDDYGVKRNSWSRAERQGAAQETA